MHEEESFILRLVYIWGFREVESDDTLKLTKEGLLAKSSGLSLLVLRSTRHSYFERGGKVR